MIAFLAVLAGLGLLIWGVFRSRRSASSRSCDDGTSTGAHSGPAEDFAGARALACSDGTAAAECEGGSGDGGSGDSGGGDGGGGD